MMPALPGDGGAGVPAAVASGYVPSSGDVLVGFTGLVAVGIGGMLGCWLRWGLGLLFNPLFPTLPPGTLAANLTGGLIIGCVMALLGHYQNLPPLVQLFVVTGFLGGLTTFSTFSYEATNLLLRQQYFWFGAHVAVHVIGSLSMTVLGLALTRSLLRY